jgi:hypothetical protein
MATPTVLSIGGVSVPASGGQTGDLLAALEKIAAAVPAADIFTPSGSASVLPVPPSTGGPFWLTIPTGYTGSLDIPTGYSYIVYDGAGTLSGGSSTATVAGTNINYTGGAAAVVGVGSGNVSLTGDGAFGSFTSVSGVAGGTYVVDASGDHETVTFDTNENGSFDATGSGDTVVTGTPAGSTSTSDAAGPLAAAAPASVSGVSIGLKGANATATVNPGSNDGIFVFQNATITAVGGTAVIVGNDTAHGGSPGTLTVDASADTVSGSQQFIYGGGGDDSIAAGLSTEYESDFTGADSYTAVAGGNDTIFALSASTFVYDGGSAASLFLLAEKGFISATVAAAQETIVGGSGGGDYAVGTSSFTFIAGSTSVGGGADTLHSGAGSAGLNLFGASGENLTITQASGTTPLGAATFTAFGNNETVNASTAGGGNEFLVVSEALSIPAANGAFAGTTTLIGSSAGHDTFLFDDSSTNTISNTITIQNWQSSDQVALFDISPGNSSQGLNAADLAAVNTFEGGGGTGSLKLSDGTTIDFGVAKGVTINHV